MFDETWNIKAHNLSFAEAARNSAYFTFLPSFLYNIQYGTFINELSFLILFFSFFFFIFFFSFFNNHTNISSHPREFQFEISHIFHIFTNYAIFLSEDLKIVSLFKCIFFFFFYGKKITIWNLKFSARDLYILFSMLIFKKIFKSIYYFHWKLEKKTYLL